jgi:hypothetical protein
MEKNKKSFMCVDTVLFFHEAQDPFRDDNLTLIKGKCKEILKVFTDNNNIECYHTK